MTLPFEEEWSLKNTRQFLADLLDCKKTKRVPKEIRQRASQCLKHFPANYRIEELWKKDEISNKEKKS